MSQTITKGVKSMLAEANAVIETIPTSEALALVEREGRIPGAFHCPRGMLEFWIDPDSPYHKPVFAQDKRYVFFCAGGMRSALAAKTAHDMGLKPVAHIEGGFGAWKKAGGMVDDGSK